MCNGNDMKTIKLFLTVLLFTCATLIQAQSLDKYNIYQKIDTTYTLFSHNNKQKLSISLVDNYYDSEFWYREYWVKVYNPIGETIQMFSEINYEAERKEDFQLEDINFDNYDDLLVLVSDSPFNECYEFWRFDILSQKYIYDSIFSDVVSCNPSFSKDSKTIYTSSADGRMMTFWDQTYNYNNGKLLLIKEESQEQYELIDSLNYQYNYRRIKKVRQGDEMIIVKEVIGTLEELDEKWDK
jgi:hypothetical protein